MDEIKATPRNKLGYLVDALRSVNGLASQNKYTNMAAELVGTPAIERTLDRMSYGEPITNIGKANVPLIPEDTGEAAMALAPMAMSAGKALVKVSPKAQAAALRMMDNAMAPATLRKESGMFIGPSAKTWDAKAAKQAQTMAARGADPRKIWSETGTFKGPDGKWRQEIPDNLASYDPEALADLKSIDSFNYLKDTHPLGGVVSHEQAYKAYPDIQDIPVHFMPQSKMGKAYGAYSQNLDRLTLSDSASGMDKTSAALHEMQHAIQKREGMSGGGNLKGLSIGDYAKLAGEAEARATQARIPLTAAQRRAKFPLDSYDVPIESLILKGAQ